MGNKKIRPPKNKTTNGQFTQGGEFIYSNGELQGTDYIGPFHIIDNNVYPGKDFIEKRLMYSTIEIETKPLDEIDAFGFKKASKKLKNIVNKTAQTVGWATNAYFFAKNNIKTAQAISAEIKNKKIIKRTSRNGEALSGIHYYAKKILPLLPLKQIISNATPAQTTPESSKSQSAAQTSRLSNISDYSIKEISYDDFINISKNPIYITVSIDFSSQELFRQVDDAEKKIPGIKSFLEIS